MDSHSSLLKREKERHTHTQRERERERERERDENQIADTRLLGALLLEAP